MNGIKTISIVTPTYNSEATIGETLQSVLQQTYKDIEMIIVDGASTDGTIDIIKHYEPLFEGRMKWVSEPDKGIYDAMNKGIKRCTGDVVGILNSDDVFFDNHVIEDIAACLNSNNIDCVFGNLMLVRQYDTKRMARVWISSPYREGAFQKGWHPAHPTFYVKRNCYEQYGMYDTSIKVSADFELMLRFLAVHHISSHYMNRFVVKMRMGGESTGSLKRIYEGNMNVVRSLRRHGFHITTLGYLSRRILPKMWNQFKTAFFYTPEPL